MFQELLLYNLRPTARQVGITAMIAVLLSAGMLGAIPFRSVPLWKLDSFVPVLDALLVLGDWMTAALFFAQVSTLRSMALMALGVGYFFSGFILIVHALTFPDAFSHTGWLGAGLDTTGWLYLVWHIGLPAGAMSYALLKNRVGWPQTALLVPRRAVAFSVMAVTALVAAITIFVTRGEALLPSVFSDSMHWSPAVALYFLLPVLVLVLAAGAMIWRGYRTVLDLWLLFMLWAAFLEICLTFIVSTRFSLGWYAGRMIGLVSSLSVLTMLLTETGRLYVRTVLTAMARERERESQLLFRDAISASIAHELRQPLSAILLNAQTGQLRIGAKVDGLSPLLSEIVAGSHRANEIITNARTLFNGAATDRRLADTNQLIRETLALIKGDARQRKIAVELKLDERVPPVAVNRLQIQEVLLNLFTNAMEAMRFEDGWPRILTVHSGSGGSGLTIRVEDTGRGVTATDFGRIFDPFFTTNEGRMGVGLTICHSVVTAHGGSIRALPSARGAVFEIYLPFDGMHTGAGR